MIERWVQALSEQDFSAEEMADAAWLALLRYRLAGQLDALEDGQARETGPGEAAGKRNKPQSSGEQQSGGDNNKASAEDGTPNTGTGTKPPAKKGQPANAALFTRHQRSNVAEGSRPERQGTPVKIRQAPALREPLTFVRALRPLIRQIATGRDAGLDETATAQKIADERVWLPVTRPQVEPWLDVAIVVDESPSMLIWRRTVWELVRLFKNYGAFRDVRVWGLVSAEQLAKAAKVAEAAAATEAANSAAPHETAPAAKVHQQLFIRPEFGGAVTEKSLRRPEVLIDPNQRRLVLVLSDCVSSFWQSGLVLPALQTWAAAGPMALVQMLPDWMWSRTVLRYAEKVDLYGLEPAIANQRLTVVRDLFADALEPKLQRQNIRVPVLTLEADKASIWSQMVGGKGSTQAPGLIFNPTVQTLLSEMEQQRQFKPVKELSPQERVQRFKAASTLVGRRLAGLLAAAPVINLQIVRLIQETLVRESEQVHVAEVLLGGLMSPVKLPAMAVNPDAVEYRFKDPEIRTLLLKGAPIDDAATILMKVSAYVNENLNRNTLDEFVAELQHWLAREGDGEADEAKPFAVVTAEVLKRRVRLSAVQAALVETVEARYPAEVAEVTTSRTAGYRNFAELSQHEREGEDYQIREAYRVQVADNFGASIDEPTSGNVRLSPSQRLELIKALDALPTEQFDNLVFAFDPPAGFVLPYGSPQGVRAPQLLDWIEGPTGPGLAEFIGILQGNFDVKLFEGVEALGESKGASPSYFAVVAIHGGTIQPGTTEVAEALAGEQHGFYTFEGLKPEKSDALYIPSHLFDEPRALRLVSGVTTVVSINGCKGDESFIHLGGLDEARIWRLRSRLIAAGFPVAETEGLRGVDPNNICNRGRSRQGIQLELSAGLRDRLREDSRALDTLVTTLRRALTPAPPPARTATDTAVADPIQKRWAFLVGINQYDDPAYGTLEFCVDDVKALGQLLESDLRFDVTCIHDDLAEHRYQPRQNNIKAELQKLCDVLGPDDLLLVYFACHGTQINNQSYLVASDSRPLQLGGMLSVREVETMMRSSRARCQVLLLDASDVGVESEQNVVIASGDRRQTYEQAEGFAVIAASAPQQQAYEIEGHGVFTRYLLEAFSGRADGYPDSASKKGFVSFQDLQTYVVDNVRRLSQETGQTQLPTVRVEGKGDMVLAYYPDGESKPAETSEPGFPELRTLEFTKAEIIDAAESLDAEAQLREVLEGVEGLPNQLSQVEALMAMMPQSHKNQHLEILRQALEITRTIADEQDRAVALTLIAPQFPQLTFGLRGQALEIAQAIASDRDRAMALTAIAPQLREEQRWEVLEQTLEAIRRIENEPVRAEALIDIVPKLPTELTELWDMGLEVARSIRDELSREAALLALMSRHPESGQEPIAANNAEPAINETLISREELEPFEFVVATLTQQDRPDPHPLPELIEATPLPNSDWIVRRYRQSAHRYLEVLSEADELAVSAASEVSDYSNYLALEMVAIPGGTFTMGSPGDEPGRYDREGPQHEVTVSPFFMGRYPVTQAQWRFVAALDRIERRLGPAPARFKGADLSVERVSWRDAIEFCARLSRYTGRDYHLPTEAEWEYACRANTETAFHFGETITPELANYIGTEPLAGGPTGEYRKETTTVGYFGVANAFGLSDMHGNVFEWCQDHWHSNYEGSPNDGSAWLTSNKEASRVQRGGSWSDGPVTCRSAYRSYDNPDYRYYDIGFRVVCRAPILT